VIWRQIGRSFVNFTDYMPVKFGVSLRVRHTGIYYCSWAAVGWATLLYISIYVFRMCQSKVMLVFGSVFVIMFADWWRNGKLLDQLFINHFTIRKMFWARMWKYLSWHEKSFYRLSGPTSVEESA
jgi:hypothetical protein